ncbi:hypothetical protein [Sulfurirhabdus autotrophica]|nr:hypothetical protein [Sulfurirhabdus autotrophica]
MIQSIAFILLAFSQTLSIARIFSVTPKNYFTSLKYLEPGDTLLLQPGNYLKGLPIHRINGEANQLITITGPTNGPQPVFIARQGHNTISINNTSYIVIRNLELDGQGFPVDGVKCEGNAEWAHHVTLENLVIKNHGNNQQSVGISTKCPAWNWVIRGNTILGAGTGIYLGNSDGSAPFVAGLIEFNRVADTIGYNLQIKHQNPRPDIAGMPTESSTTIIRHNLFSKTNNGATGPLARPNVLVGHWPLSGHGTTDRYEIYGNFFYQNPTEALFQGEGNIALYNNLFINDDGNAIRIRPHNDIPRAIAIFYNTVIASGTGISITIGPESEGFTQKVTANAVFAKQPIVAKWQKSNITDARLIAANYLVRPFVKYTEINLYPKKGQLKLQKLDSSIFNAFTDGDKDFNGRKREGLYCGAYSGDGRNPGWIPKLSDKIPF